MSGTLFIVATPIGNLEDLSARALDTLRNVDAIACEDTRVTSKLLFAFEISKPLVSLQEHSSDKKVDELIERLKRGENVAYVSDAGTPGVNDPGGKLAERAFESRIKIVPIPGPSALTTAISVCGFPMNRFTYIGFLPLKGKAGVFRDIAEREEATIFLESTHRIAKTLDGLKQDLQPSRLIFVGRELTKLHETLYRGTIDDVIESLQHTSLKGEFVIIVAPKTFA